MLIRNWNIVDDDYFNNEEVRQREDAREAQYQQDTEKYKLSVGGLWLAEETDKYGDTGFVINPKDALVMHSSQCKRAIAVLGKNVPHAIEVWHWRPVARLDVDTARLFVMNENDKKRYIVQHEDGWVHNNLFENCYHWQIATPLTFDDAYRIANAHKNMQKAVGSYQDVWILVLGWAQEKLEDVETR